MARTAMLDFNVDPSFITEKGPKKDLLNKIEDFLAELEYAPHSEYIQLGKGMLCVYNKPNLESSAILRFYKKGLVSITLEEHEIPHDNSILEDKQLEIIRKKLSAIVEKKVEKSPIFKHALEVPVYFNTSEERVLEYDFDKVLFDKESEFQNIKILSSPTLGNCLILDDHQNLGDCDIAYTHGLMKKGQLNYKDKEVFIMGGGDGGLLHELLKEKPKFVTLVDIDQMVIDACRIHLRGCCGDTLDRLSGPNYTVIIDDCIKIMDQYIAEGRTFDYVFNDLTDIPISTGPKGEPWEFVKMVLTKGLKLIKPDGRYLNHAIGETCKDALKQYEELLRSLPEKVEFISHTAFVPSFIENWTFYEIWKIN